MEKRPINETLRRMEVGSVEKFPLTQYVSLRATIYSGSLMQDRAEGKSWTLKPDMAEKVVVVTRTA